MFSHFKNDSIRKLVIAFGSLFNNVQLEQKDENEKGDESPLFCVCRKLLILFEFFRLCILVFYYIMVV